MSTWRGLLVLVWLVAACGSQQTATNAGASHDNGDVDSDAPAPADADVPQLVTGLEGTGDAPPSSGCPFLSADGKRAGCLTYVLEMGYLASALTIHDLEKKGAEIKRWIIHDGNIGLPTSVKSGPLANANWYLHVGRFTREGAVPERSGMKTVAQPAVPIELGANAERCCRMLPEAASVWSRVRKLSVTFEVSCQFHGDPTKLDDVCFIEDYNDESHPFATIHVFDSTE